VTGNLGASRRLIRRLAEGVPRSRIADSLVSARPRVAVIAAPSGYGKTVVAAQIADSGSFSDVVWISGTGASGGIEAVLLGLAEVLTGSATDIGQYRAADCVVACCAELGARPDGQPILIVIDDASWVGDAQDVEPILRVAAEAPAGSLLVITMRGIAPIDWAAAGAWEVRPADLLFDSSELATLWHDVTGRRPIDPETAQLADVSGGHPALAALTLRCKVLAGEHGSVRSDSGSLAALIRGLAEAQLNSKDRGTLAHAALLQAGLVSDLESCVQDDGMAASLERVSWVLPLVRAFGKGQSRFRSTRHSVRSNRTWFRENAVD
jgi:ATP/maltotriose-dependent transcriptional regulator MalT